MNFIGNNFFGLLDNQPSTSTGFTSSTLNSININQMYTISHIESIEVNEATVATELLASTECTEPRTILVSL